MNWRVCLSTLTVFLNGSLLHFAWEWSGRSMFVAIVAATNESTWEHLKLAFWPALGITPIQRLFYGPAPSWLVATAIRCVLPAFLIVLFFYGYTAFLGEHFLVADIAIFAVAILLGESLGHRRLSRDFTFGIRAYALGALILSTILFATLTFSPPDCFLFEQPHFD